MERGRCLLVTLVSTLVTQMQLKPVKVDSR